MSSQALNLIDPDVLEREIAQKVTDCTGTLSILVIDPGSAGNLFEHSDSAAAMAFQGTIARLLIRMCRDDDRVYSICESRFALLLNGLESPVLRQLAAEKVIRLYRSALDELDPGCEINVSIGIASYPEHAQAAGELFRNAVLALESVEQGGGYAIYSSEAAAID